MKKLLILCILLTGVMQVVHAKVPYIVMSDENKTLTFYYDNEKNSRGGVDIGYFQYYIEDGKYRWEELDGLCGWGSYREQITKVVFDPSFEDLSITNTPFLLYRLTKLTQIEGLEYLNTDNMFGLFQGCHSLENIDLRKLKTAGVKSMGNMFADCWNLTNIDLSNFHTEDVESMDQMFASCEKLTNIDLSNFVTGKVKWMSGMFKLCEKLESITFNKNSFNTENVESMGGMFEKCYGLTNLDLSHFNTGKVENFSRMFYNCENLQSLNITNFNTENATQMSEMFYGCLKLTDLDVSNFNTTNIENMQYMFAYCQSLTSLDLRNFDINDTYFHWMFYYCENLKTIYCNDTWPTRYKEVFEGCFNLKGGHGTAYTYGNVSSDFAHPNVGGYFTSKGTTFSTVTIGTSVQYWSSFYTTTRNVKADDNTTVYTATLSSDGTELTLNEIADKVIPCGQAVLMRSTVKEPVLTTSASIGTGDFSNNSLQGTQTDIPTSSISGNVYTLASESGDFGFFRYTGETLKGGKAFLVVPGSAAARITIFGLDDATGIQNVSTEDHQKACFDLQGRRVETTKKGIYIINGKKVVK